MLKFKSPIIILFIIAGAILISAVKPTVQIGLVKYNGGGDWYANPTSLPNLIQFCNKNIGTNIQSDYATVEVGDEDIFNYPFLHLTGHGNVVFSDQEADNLRNYLVSGGFCISMIIMAWINISGLK
jgi:hypothetical protein